MRSFRVPLVAALARLASGGLAGTYRLRRIVGEEHFRRAVEPPAIFAFWHEQALLAVPLVRRRLLARGVPVSVLSSLSADGEISARILGSWGVRVRRGSSSRGGREAALKLYRELVKHRSTLVLTPDGPRGPAFSAKMGGLVLAAMSGAPIVPAGFAADRRFRLRSWDRMIVGLPFCSLAIAFGEPIVLGRESSANEREAARVELEARLDALSRHAERLLTADR